MRVENQSLSAVQSNASNCSNARPRLLTADEVARELNVSRSFAYQMMQDGTIPVVRLGRAVRCRPQDLDAFIVANVSNGSRVGGTKWGA
jgi:excisionase family DNA binding protein